MRLVIAGMLVTGCGMVRGTLLATDPTWQGGCSIGVGRDATLQGSAEDPRLAWAIDDSGDRVELLWPNGYSARFSPQLVVVDGSGQIVARDGDLIVGSCMTRPGDGDAMRIDGSDIRPPDWQPGDG